MASTKTATLAKFGLAGVALGAVLSLTVTTLTVTTGHFTTANVQTLSGSTIKNTDGSITIDGTDLETTKTISGSTIRAITAFTGAKLSATPTSGTAAVIIFGNAKGSHLCIWDTDGAGWTAVDTLNGTVTARIATAGECP